MEEIYLDSDVLIHFVKGEALGVLPMIYGNRLNVLDLVAYELKSGFKPDSRQQLANAVRAKLIKVVEFPTDIGIVREFIALNRSLPGNSQGECACMVYVKNFGGIIASSNMRDVHNYCEENGLKHITTMDILVSAFDSGFMTESECNRFIKKVRKRGSVLPDPNLRAYFRRIERYTKIS